MPRVAHCAVKIPLSARRVLSDANLIMQIVVDRKGKGTFEHEYSAAHLWGIEGGGGGEKAAQR